MKMKAKWETVSTVILIGCALITTTLVARREFAARSGSELTTRDPVFIKDWKSYIGQGVTFGPPNAPVRLIEFADFECPFCADLYRKLKVIRERYSSDLSITYMHFPLQGHRFALRAARVAECAAEQGQVESIYDHLFEEQDSLGLKSWDEYAKEAGVADLARFDSCVEDTRSVARIEDGKQLGEKLAVKVTPTLIVNGWMLGRPPTVDELDAMVKAVLAGKPPVSTS